MGKTIQRLSVLNERKTIQHGRTNSWRQVTRATKYYTVAPNTGACGSSVWNVLHVTILEPRILRGLLIFREIFFEFCLRALVDKQASK